MIFHLTKVELSSKTWKQHVNKVKAVNVNFHLINYACSFTFKKIMLQLNQVVPIPALWKTAAKFAICYSVN